MSVLEKNLATRDCQMDREKYCNIYNIYRSAELSICSRYLSVIDYQAEIIAICNFNVNKNLILNLYLR